MADGGNPMTSTPSEIQNLLDRGASAVAEEALLASLPSDDAPDDDALVWSRLAQQLGRLDLAERLLRAALRNAPGDTSLASELDSLLDDLGDPERLPRDSDDGTDGETGPGDGETGSGDGDPASLADRIEAATAACREPDDADVARFVHLFAGREGVHARQWSEPNGNAGYSPIRAPLTAGVARAHLSGEVTVGSYLVRHDDTVTFFVLDLDLTKRALQEAAGDAQALAELRLRVDEAGLRLLEQTAGLGLSLLLIDSGHKGRHLWGLLARPLPADLVHRFGRLLRRALRPADVCLDLEFFPKQAHVADGGLGNLVKLPLGVHRRSGRRALLLDGRGLPEPDPWARLRGAVRVSRTSLLDAMAKLRELPAAVEPVERRSARPAPGPASTASRPPARQACVELLDQDPGIGRLRRACGVVDGLARRALESRRLSHDERVVLTHSIGYCERGPEALNGLFLHCPEVSDREWLRRPLRGHPISCLRIRQRVAELSAQVGCHCAFDHQPADYPSPVLLARAGRGAGDPAIIGEADTSQPPPVDASTRPLEEALALALRALPDHALPVAGGRWLLDDTDSVTVRWQPDGEA